MGGTLDADAVADIGWEGRNWELRAALRSARRGRVDAGRPGRRNLAADLLVAARGLAEEGDGQFTVKQVADRAGTALQTFYRHFGSKDELLLALIEENVADGCVGLAAAFEHEDDPLQYLRSVVRGMILLAADDATQTRLRFHARDRTRLSELYPAAVEAALAPSRDLLMAAMIGAATAERIRPTDIERDTDIVLHLVVTYAHAVEVHSLPWSADDVADHVWGFCLAGLRGDET